ncbi:MAG: glycosyltransferase family 2 protein [Candidatus Pacearchaeota archaeon]|jgi:glycosyltransferase involved in cell wall biosynthesis
MLANNNFKKTLKKPKLSIIIPVYNEERHIDRLMGSLKDQTYKNFEIIFVDDGSTDSSMKKIRSYKEVKLLEQKHCGPGNARNLGSKIAKGEILIFVDADMTFDKDYLKYLIEPVVNREVIGTEEELQIAKNAEHNIWSKCLGKIVSDPNQESRTIFRAILKSKFLELGGFDAKYGYADDQTFLFKYNLRPGIARKAVCYHDNPDNLKSVYKQSRWVGSSSRMNWLNWPVGNWFIIFLLVLASPLAVIYLSIKKSLLIKNFKIFIPWMLIFTTVRYFGNLAGYRKKILTGENFR